MAIQNDPRLYSGGAVEFDSTPTLNTFARLQEKRAAEERAREEAANQYFNNVIKELNPAGIRQVHLGGVPGQQKGIIDKINEWKDWSIKNRDSIVKGGTARMQSDMRAQEIMRDIARAKSRDKQLLELGKLKFEGKYDPTEDDFKVLDKFGKSIYDPESYKEDGVTEFGFEDLSPNIPDYDYNKAFETGTKGMKGGRTFDESKARKDASTGLEWIPYTEKFSDAQIPQIARNVANEYQTNKSAKKYWDAQWKKISEEDYKKLNATFKQYFPQEKINLPNGQVIDMGNIDTPEELAIASSALRAKEFVSEQGEVSKSDYEKRYQDQVNKIYISDALIRGRKGAGGNDVDLSNYDVFGRYEPKIKTVNIPLVGNVKVIGYNDVDVSDKKLIGDVAPVTVDNQKFYIVRSDGDWEGKGGQVISRANAARKNMDATSLNEVQRGRLENDIVPNQNIRLPKDPKKTKMQVKKGELD